MSERRWYCVRQVAGPLVKECRALRPRLSADDSLYDRRLKNQILHPPRDSAVCHGPVDRLELRIALFGYTGTFYSLTFDDDHLPVRWQEGKRLWRNYISRLRYSVGGTPLDCISCLEGQHGDHRYHFHAVFNDEQIPLTEVRRLWRYGVEIEDEPVLLPPRDSFRRLGIYLNKERRDGHIIPIDTKPWVCSRSLLQKLPPPERWMDTSGHIEIPDNVYNSGRNHIENEFGCYEYAWYIMNRETYRRSLILK